MTKRALVMLMLCLSLVLTVGCEDAVPGGEKLPDVSMKGVEEDSFVLGENVSANMSAGSEVAVSIGPDDGACTFESADIYDLVHARLELPGDETMYEITDPDQLAELETLLSTAESIGPADDENGLIFHSYYTLLYLERADGVVGVLYPAEDGSDIWMCNDRFHYYHMGAGGSANLWEKFGAPMVQ